MDAKAVQTKLKAAMQLIPYLKLVERERLRVLEKSKQAYTKFFENYETSQLFDDVFLNKLTISQIILLLKEKPFPTSKIAKILGMTPSDVSRQMTALSRHGMVAYDTISNCYEICA